MPENRANGIRAYTDKTRRRGLKSGPLKLRCFLESASGGHRLYRRGFNRRPIYYFFIYA